MNRTAFVTVGSTKFDALIQFQRSNVSKTFNCDIRAVDDVRIAEALIDLGFQKLIIQKGNGTYVLHNLMQEMRSAVDDFTVQCFDYVPSLDEIVQKSDLIICHAGSGSVFEGLQAEKTLITVPNAALMDNHQLELAEKLESMEHLISATPETLLAKLKQLHSFKKVPYEAGNPQRIAQRIDLLFERQRKP